LPLLRSTCLILLLLLLLRELTAPPSIADGADARHVARSSAFGLNI